MNNEYLYRRFRDLFFNIKKEKQENEISGKNPRLLMLLRLVAVETSVAWARSLMSQLSSWRVSTMNLKQLAFLINED